MPRATSSQMPSSSPLACQPWLTTSTARASRLDSTLYTMSPHCPPTPLSHLLLFVSVLATLHATTAELALPATMSRTPRPLLDGTLVSHAAKCAWLFVVGTILTAVAAHIHVHTDYVKMDNVSVCVWCLTDLDYPFITHVGLSPPAFPPCTHTQCFHPHESPEIYYTQMSKAMNDTGHAMWFNTCEWCVGGVGWAGRNLFAPSRSCCAAQGKALHRGEDSVWLWGGKIAQSFRVGPGMVHGSVFPYLLASAASHTNNTCVRHCAQTTCLSGHSTAKVRQHHTLCPSNANLTFPLLLQACMTTLSAW